MSENKEDFTFADVLAKLKLVWCGYMSISDNTKIIYDHTKKIHHTLLTRVWCGAVWCGVVGCGTPYHTGVVWLHV